MGAADVQSEQPPQDGDAQPESHAPVVHESQDVQSAHVPQSPHGLLRSPHRLHQASGESNRERGPT